MPVVHSLMAVDVLPYESPLRQGMIGTYGNRWCNLAVGLSDLLIVLGSRLDVRQTGSLTESFKAGRNIIHVDCEQGELNNRVKGCDTILADIRQFLMDFVENAHPSPQRSSQRWKSGPTRFQSYVLRILTRKNVRMGLGLTRTSSCTNCPAVPGLLRRMLSMWDSIKCGPLSLWKSVQASAF